VRYYTLGLHANGGLAELAKAPARMCRPVPDACTDDAAAMAQPLAVALHAVRRSGAAPGQTIAVMGAGGIGAFMIAAARARGLGPLIAIDIDEDRLVRAAGLGAAHIVDARSNSPLESVRALTNGAGADVFVEASGAPNGPALALDAVRQGGQILLVGLQAEARALDLHRLVLNEVNVATTMAHVCDIDLPEALAILATTELAATVLDRVIPLEALVSDGLLAMSEGRARGKVVVDPRA
jgi:threonine dehydrogenase-like Zn-dependent dehydrogenase